MHTRCLAIAAMAAALAGCESASHVDPQDAGPLINGPIAPTSATWARLPSGPVMAAAYPVIARESHIGGDMRIGCHVTKAGRLTGCVVVSENPPGYGFGAAALSLAPEFRLKPGNYGPDASIVVPIRLTLGG